MFFSIVIPVFNKSKTLYRSIDSVLKQQFDGQFEIIIVDDGSTDEIDDVIKYYSNDKRVVFIREPNLGVSMARNNGISHAQGDYICFLDADDLFFENHLSTLKSLIADYPDVRFFSTSHVVVSDKKKVMHSAHYLRRIPNESFISDNLLKLQNDFHDSIVHTNSICIKRSLLLEEGYAFAANEKKGEDTDMWYRVSLKNKIAITKQETTCYDRRESTATKESTNTLDWVFYRRKNEILSDIEIANSVKSEYLKMMDRYVLRCCRQLCINGERKKALERIKEVAHKNGARYYLSLLLCYFPFFTKQANKGD